jgi:hypothetical protein
METLVCGRGTTNRHREKVIEPVSLTPFDVHGIKRAVRRGRAGKDKNLGAQIQQ